MFTGIKAVRFGGSITGNSWLFCTPHSYYYTSDKLKVRESPEIGWFVEHLKEFIIRSPEEALALLAAGDKRKHVSESKYNHLWDIKLTKMSWGLLV